VSSFACLGEGLTHRMVLSKNMSSARPEKASLNAQHEPATKTETSTYQKPDSEDGWQKCVETMKDHDEKLLKGWRDELSNLLVFVSRGSDSERTWRLIESRLVSFLRWSLHSTSSHTPGCRRIQWNARRKY
jgi:hypothetical protein